MTEQEYLDARAKKMMPHNVAKDAFREAETEAKRVMEATLAPFEAAVKATKVPEIRALVLVDIPGDSIDTPGFEAFPAGTRGKNGWVAQFNRVHGRWILDYGYRGMFNQGGEEIIVPENMADWNTEYRVARKQAIDILIKAGWEILEFS